MQNVENKSYSPDYLSPTFHPLIEKDNGFYAYEDSKLLSVGIEQSIESLRGQNKPITLIDLCTGTAKIPAQFLIDKKVNRVLGVDISSDYSKKVSSAIHKIVEKPNFEIKKCDILNDDLHTFVENIHKIESAKILSANPPWIPVPDSISSTDSKLQLVNGGKDGLRFVEPILKMADDIDASKISVNIPSIADIQKFSEILQAKNLMIENIQALDTFSYGIDATPEIRNHYTENISSNSYRIDNEGQFRYLVLNLRLKKSEEESSQSIQNLQTLLDLYKSASSDDMKQFNEFMNSNTSFCKLWQLAPDDKFRILKALD